MVIMSMRLLLYGALTSDVIIEAFVPPPHCHSLTMGVKLLSSPDSLAAEKCNI